MFSLLRRIDCAVRSARQRAEFSVPLISIGLRERQFGLINPKWARFRNRASSVGVLVLAGMLFVGSAGSALVAWITWVVFDYFLTFMAGGPD